MEATDVVLEIVEWDDVRVPRTIFSKAKNPADWFEIPSALYERWEQAVNEFWAVQSELLSYSTGDKRVYTEG